MNEFSKDIAAEKFADRISYMLVAVFTFLSWVTLSVTSQIDAIRANTGEPALQFWFVQFTSHIVIFGMAGFIPFLLSRFPITLANWKRSSLGFVLGFTTFGVAHVLSMIILRKLGWPFLFEVPYEFGITQPIVWFYELQKDAYTFILLVTIFWLGRVSARQMLEYEGRRAEAIESGRITLTSGGRIFVVNADDIRVAKAAANYVEIQTPEKTLLARITLSELERLLSVAGDEHIRIHRSCIVHKTEIRELKPNGDGSATVTLKNGGIEQISRSHRASTANVLLDRSDLSSS